MSWFQKKASRDRVSLPFPVERISALEPIVAAAIENACRMRGSPKVQHTHIVMSKAFNYYICGFPKFLDYQDPQLGASVRKMILTMFITTIRFKFDLIRSKFCWKTIISWYQQRFPQALLMGKFIGKT